VVILQVVTLVLVESVSVPIVHSVLLSHRINFFDLLDVHVMVGVSPNVSLLLLRGRTVVVLCCCRLHVISIEHLLKAHAIPALPNSFPLFNWLVLQPNDGVIIKAGTIVHVVATRPSIIVLDIVAVVVFVE